MEKSFVLKYKITKIPQKIGQHLEINYRCLDLKRKDGSECPFVAKNGDIVIVLEKLPTNIVVIFFEDTVTTRQEEAYGPFVIEMYQIRAF